MASSPLRIAYSTRPVSPSSSPNLFSSWNLPSSIDGRKGPHCSSLRCLISSKIKLVEVGVGGKNAFNRMIESKEAGCLTVGVVAYPFDLEVCKQSLQRMPSFGFTKAFILANTLMFFLPLDVLAETCEADNSIFNMPLLFGIALIGATVGGLLARQRKGELIKLNDQLRQINAALRRQAKIESYAPNLSYAPVGRTPETEVIVDPRKHQIIAKLRTGKNHLRNQDPEKAFTEFKAALEIAQALGDHVEEKKAARGLGASLQRQGKYKDAIKYHSQVLEISKRVGEHSGTTEAYGAIADCYTEVGDLEKAGKFYDKYIARLETD